MRLKQKVATAQTPVGEAVFERRKNAGNTHTRFVMYNNIFIYYIPILWLQKVLVLTKHTYILTRLTPTLLFSRNLSNFMLVRPCNSIKIDNGNQPQTIYNKV